jgi:hypothetical protein
MDKTITTEMFKTIYHQCQGYIFYRAENNKIIIRQVAPNLLVSNIFKTLGV